MATSQSRVGNITKLDKAIQLIDIEDNKRVRIGVKKAKSGKFLMYAIMLKAEMNQHHQVTEILYSIDGQYNERMTCHSKQGNILLFM